jgi:excisionase family DNA binding protein
MERITYTVPEVAELLGISRSTAYECVRRGDIPALALGRRIVVRAPRSNNWSAARATRPRTPVMSTDPAASKHGTTDRTASQDRVGTTAPRNGTDCAVPPCGTAGSNLRASIGYDASDLLELLNFARSLGPPIPDDYTGFAAEAWLRDVLEANQFRRYVYETVREARWAAADAWRVLQMLKSEQACVERRARREAEHAANVFWTQRVARRKAQRPVRVVVDPIAWRRAKRLAREEGVTVGEYVGVLVVAELNAKQSMTRAPQRRPSGEPLTVFLRIAINDTDWSRVREVATDKKQPVGRIVGLAVESSRAV